jgi:hypothetical protein
MNEGSREVKVGTEVVASAGRSFVGKSVNNIHYQAMPFAKG